MKIITIAVALLSVMGPPHVIDGLPQSNPFDNGSVDNNSKKPEEIAAFWTADRRKNTVSRDIGITPNGTAFSSWCGWYGGALHGRKRPTASRTPPSWSGDRT